MLKTLWIKLITHANNYFPHHLKIKSCKNTFTFRVSSKTQHKDSRCFKIKAARSLYATWNESYMTGSFEKFVSCLTASLFPAVYRAYQRPSTPSMVWWIKEWMWWWIFLTSCGMRLQLRSPTSRNRCFRICLTHFPNPVYIFMSGLVMNFCWVLSIFIVKYVDTCINVCLCASVF